MGKKAEKNKFKRGPTAHGATAPAELVDFGSEFPGFGVIIPPTHSEGVHIYGVKEIRKFSKWLSEAADFIEMKESQ